MSLDKNQKKEGLSLYRKAPLYISTLKFQVKQSYILVPSAWLWSLTSTFSVRPA